MARESRRAWPAPRTNPRRPGASCPGVPRLASYLHAPNLRRPSPPRSLSSGAFRGRNAPRWASSRHGLEFRARGGPCTRCPEIKRGPWRPRNVPAEATYQGSASKSVAGSDGSRQVLEPRGMKPRGVALFPQSSRDAGNAISWLANLVVLGQPRAQTPRRPGASCPGVPRLAGYATLTNTQTPRGFILRFTHILRTLGCRVSGEVFCLSVVLPQILGCQRDLAKWRVEIAN
jgi:hypothetical protein